MKKIMIGLVAAACASNAFAVATFEFGSVWFFPKYDNNPLQPYNLTGQGQAFTASWDMSEDFSIGAYMENIDLNSGDGDTYVWRSQAIVITKGVVKNATIGLRFGTFEENSNWWPVNGFNGVVTDVIGNVTLMAGTAERVSGSLKATFGARFARDNEFANNWGVAEDFGGYLLALSVGVGI